MLDIFFFSPHSDPQAELGEPDAGGQCLYEDQLAKALSDIEGVRVTTFCRFSGERELHQKVNDHYSIVRIQAGPAEFIPKEEIEPLLPEFINEVKKYISAKPFKGTKKVVHGHYWDGAKASLIFKACMPDIGTVWTPHSLATIKRETFPGAEQEKKYNFLPRLVWENYILYSSEQVIVSTEQEKDVTVKRYQTDPEKVQVIPPGLDFGDLEMVEKAEARQKYHLPQQANILLCLGRMTASKGYEYGIQVLEELKKKKLDDPTYLVICGGPDLDTPKKSSDAVYKKELYQIAKDKGLADKVIFFAAMPHQDVKYMFRAADVFLMTSESEPFGLTPLEAMALNRPVVSFNKGGPAHLITHNRTGCLVRPRDTEQMAGYVTALLKDIDYRSDITTNAYHFVRQNFDWKVLAKKFLTVYQQALTQVQSQCDFEDEVKNNYFLHHNLEVA